jgi:uncharacterized membrane protein AbrB (regulator of aidB expression)
MSLWLVLFGLILAGLLARANHAPLAFLIGGGVLALLIIVPWIEDAIAPRRIERRPAPRRRKR